MLLMYAIFAPLLVALATGAFLFVWSQNKHSGFGKFMGGIITLAAIVLLVLQSWQTSKLWHDGAVIKKEMQKMMRQMPETTPEKSSDKK